VFEQQQTHHEDEESLKQTNTWLILVISKCKKLESLNEEDEAERIADVPG
jgi:hypothetical protein